MASFGFYVVSQNAGGSTYNFTAPVVAINTTKKIPKKVVIIPTTPVVNNPQPKPVTSKPKPVPVVTPPPPKKTGIYNDGEYIGNSADAYYGYIQVKAVITNGKLADVIFLDYPHDRSTSARINSRAMPILIQEAIAAQSANVNGVSGASATSPAFVESLTSALSQAKA